MRCVRWTADGATAVPVRATAASTRTFRHTSASARSSPSASLCFKPSTCQQSTPTSSASSSKSMCIFVCQFYVFSFCLSNCLCISLLFFLCNAVSFFLSVFWFISVCLYLSIFIYLSILSICLSLFPPLPRTKALEVLSSPFLFSLFFKTFS